MDYNIDRFTFFASYWASIQRMDPERQRRMFVAIMGFMFEGKEPELEDDILLASVFDAMRPNLESSLNSKKTGALGQETKGALKEQNKGPKKNNLRGLKTDAEGALNKKNKGPSEKEKRGLPTEREEEREGESEKEGDAEAERESARAIATPSTSIEFPDMGGREEYGFYNNVHLTPRELGELQRRYPHDFQKMIENLSAYLKRTGKIYADHFETMIQWKEADDRKANERDLKQVKEDEEWKARVERFLNADTRAGTIYEVFDQEGGTT